MDMKPMINFVVGSLNLPSEKDGIIDLTEGGATAVSSLINDDSGSENDSPKISKINDEFKGKLYERNSFNSIEKSREKALEREKEKALEEYYPGSTGTVGCVVMMHGHVAAATSTGGLTNKMAGRVGDTSIIGAGTYANDETCAVSATGKGEEFMRHVAAYDVSARVEIGGMTLEEAVQDTVFKKLPSESGGIIAINRLGEYSMQFNSRGMFRAVCDSYGDCQVGIWEDLIPFQMTPQGDAPIIVTGYSEKMKNEDIEDLVRQ
jgi:beta-aspartyl-peptidase (threonine type)